MNTKFTKGEWFVNAVDSKTWVDTETGLTVAQVFDVEGHPYDANLIAAAPDMYKLLEEFKLFAVRQGWDHVLINDAEKLLAKARGE